MHGAVRGGRQSRAQTVGMTGHTASRNGTSRLVQLRVVMREPGRAEYSRSSRRGDEEQVNHLSVVARDDQSERSRPVCHMSDGFAVMVQDGFRFRQNLNWDVCLLRQSIINETIIGAGVDQKREREGGRELWSHSNVLGRTMWEDEGEQEEIALTSTPVCAGELTLLAAWDRK